MMIPRIRVPGSYQHFAASMPMETHWREAHCREVECPHYLMGWKTLIDESTPFGQGQANYIRFQSGRRFVEHREAGITIFVFHPEQRCFRGHKIKLERGAVLTCRVNGMVQPQEPEQWIDNMKEAIHQNEQKVKEG